MSNLKVWDNLGILRLSGCMILILLLVAFVRAQDYSLDYSVFGLSGAVSQTARNS